MIIQPQKGLGIFVRADRVDEITVCGEFAHIYMASGHTHYIPQDKGSTAHETAIRIQKMVNDVLKGENLISKDEIFHSRVGQTVFPFGAAPDHP